MASETQTRGNGEGCKGPPAERRNGVRGRYRYAVANGAGAAWARAMAVVAAKRRALARDRQGRKAAGDRNGPLGATLSAWDRSGCQKRCGERGGREAGSAHAAGACVKG